MIERRDTVLEYESRTDGPGRVSGVVISYGDVADTPFGRERFERGAFGPLTDVDLIANVQHDRARPVARTGAGLLVTDSPAALTTRIDLADTVAGRDAGAMIRVGLLRGLSVEFRAIRERQENLMRVIERARLLGFGMVDKPAYSGSLITDIRAEIRQDGNGIAGRFDYDTDEVISDRAESRQARNVRKRRVSPGAFTYTLSDPTREVNLVLGNSYATPLASRLAGTLELRDTPTALEFVAEALPDTSYVRDFRAMLSAGAARFGVRALFRMPPAEVVPDAEEVVPEPEAEGGAGILVIRQAILTALGIVTRAPRGNPGDVQMRRKALYTWR